MTTVSRREFLKIIGGASALSLVSLCGCGKIESKERFTEVSFNEIRDYEIIFRENETMLVKYDIKGGEFSVTQLNTIDGGFEKEEIYKTAFMDYDENRELFYTDLGVTDNSLAYPVLEEYFGSKNYYTIDEVNTVLVGEKEKYMKTSQKKLVK